LLLDAIFNKNFMDCKNLILIFPPGAGSNHVANMLSTCTGFMPHFESDDYIGDLNRRYLDADSIHHFRPNPNVTTTWLEENIPRLKLSAGINILVAHFGEFLGIRYLLDSLPSVHAMVFELPDYHELPSRVFFHGLRNYNYFYSEQKSMYQRHVIRQLCINSTVGAIQYTDLFTPSLTRLEHELGVKFPDICATWHTLWYNRVQQWIKENP
jgi:hypothetical protein